MYTWQGPKKTYTKWILVPLWITQIIFLLAVVGGLGYMMLELSGETDSGYVPPALSAAMAFTLIALFMEPLEMVFQSYRILEPWLYLTFQVYKAVVGTVLLAGGIYIVVQQTGVVGNLVYLVVVVFVVLIGLMALAFYASLIYAAIVMHHHRKGSSYEAVKEAERRDDESFYSRDA